MSKALFAYQSQQFPGHELKNTDMLKAHFFDANKALVELKSVIDLRCQMHGELIDFVSVQRAHYQDLSVQYERSPSRELEQRKLKLKQSFDTLIAALDASNVPQSIARLSTRYQALSLALSQKEAIYNSELNFK